MNVRELIIGERLSDVYLAQICCQGLLDGTLSPLVTLDDRGLESLAPQFRDSKTDRASPRAESYQVAS